MSKELVALLKKANELNRQITILEGNKELLDWCLSEDVELKEMKVSFTTDGLNGGYISIEPENIKKIAFLINEGNEKQLAQVQSEFEACFPPKQQAT